MRRCDPRIALHSGSVRDLGCNKAEHPTFCCVPRAHVEHRLFDRIRGVGARADAGVRRRKGGRALTSVQVLEWVSRVTPLGVRFLDTARRKTVDDDLSAIVYPAAERELWTAGVVNRGGIHVFRNVFGL